MAGTFCTSGAVVFKAGANASTALVEADYDYAILQAESEINAETRFNWIDVYGTLNVDVKYILEEACSDLAAMYVINYDMSAYTSRFEATTMLDVLYEKAKKAKTQLKEIKVQDFVNTP